MAAARTANTIRLKDGRALGYADYGDPAGRPLFYLHGFPNSRVGAQMAGAVAARRGIRLIAPDRPGIGLSDFKPGRAIGDWPADMLELVDALGIDRFALMGMSGGGPYVAACALKIPERLTAAAIVSGVAPFDEPAATADLSRWDRMRLGLGRRFPWMTRVSLWLVAQGMRRFPDRMVSLGSRSLSASDKAVLARPEVRAAIIDDYVEAFRQGTRGTAWDARLYLRPWGFRLEEIAMEVHLWQGEEDRVIPPSMGRYQAQTIPNCRARFYPGEGHFLINDRMEEIQRALIP